MATMVLLAWLLFYGLTVLGLIISNKFNKLSVSRPEHKDAYKQEAINWISFKRLQFIPAFAGVPVLLIFVYIFISFVFGQSNYFVDYILMCLPPFLLMQTYLWGYRNKLNNTRSLFDSNFRKIVLLLSFVFLSLFLLLGLLHEFSGPFQNWCAANSYPGKCFALGLIIGLISLFLAPFLGGIAILHYFIAKK